MGAFTDLDNLVNVMTGGGSVAPEQLFFYKRFQSAGAALTTATGRWTSLWTADGYPSIGAAPGAVAAPTNATTGSLGQVDPTGGRTKYLLSAGAMSGISTAVTVVLVYDRLLHISGFDGTVLTAQNVGGALTRYTNGIGNFMFTEIYTTIGVTARTISASYTNQAAASKTSAAVAIGAAGADEAGRAILMPLASGDYGIEAVASCTLSATTGTAGNFGITVGHPLAYVCINTPISAGAAISDYMTVVPVASEIKTGACISFLVVGGSATQNEITGFVNMAEV